MSAQPLKRSKALMPLSREHHFELLLAWKIRQGLHYGADPERVANYIRYLNDNLIKAHLQDEEKFFFLPLLPDDSLCMRAMKEHDELRELVDRTSRAPYDVDRFYDLADTIDRHVRFEERVLFPHLELVLSREQLSALEKKIVSAHENFRETWEDPFWEKSKSNF